MDSTDALSRSRCRERRLNKRFTYRADKMRDAHVVVQTNVTCTCGMSIVRASHAAGYGEHDVEVKTVRFGCVVAIIVLHRIIRSIARPIGYEYDNPLLCGFNVAIKGLSALRVMSAMGICARFYIHRCMQSASANVDLFHVADTFQQAPENSTQC